MTGYLYTVHQLNSYQNRSDEDLAIMRKIYELMSPGFKNPLTTDDFVSLEMEHYEDKSAYTQFFYLTADNGDIACVHEVFPRKGYHENSINLLVTMVYTNPAYRRQGLIGKLINWVMEYYETGDVGDKRTILVSDSINNGLMDKYLEVVIPKKVRDSNDIHWSLYSIVDTFYTKFGYTACGNINWLETDLTDVNVSEFVLRSNEKVLTSEEVKDMIKQEKYWFCKTECKDFHNCSFEETSIPGFIARYQSYLKLHQAELGPKVAIGDISGFQIKNGNKETFISFSPFFFMNRIVITRVYTEETDPQVFASLWEHALQFIYQYATKVWDTLPPVPSNENIIMLADNDFVNKGQTITSTKFLEIVTSYDTWKNVGTGIVLPHIRDWKQYKEIPSKIAHNGFWSFM